LLEKIADSIINYYDKSLDEKTAVDIRLNPNEAPPAKPLKRNLLPLHGKYFNTCFAANFKTFLETDASTDEGMRMVAKDFGVYNEWNAYLKELKQDDCATKYYQLLLLVKTMTQDDHMWISFVEGLYQHAAIVMCLTCSDFDLQNNYIEQGSLKTKDFQIGRSASL
jgi:hypothetical protein